MQAFLPNDVSPVEHVFDLRQLIEMLDAAGHIKLPEGSRVLGAEVTAQGHLVVSVAHGAAYYGPNTAPLKLRHDFAEEIALQAQIRADADAGRDKLIGTISDVFRRDADFREETRQRMEEQRFEAEQQTKLQEQMEQAVPLAEEVQSEHTRPLHTMPVAQAVNEMKYRVKDLYPKAHPEKTFTPYAFVFQSTPLERDSRELAVPFIPGENVLNILNRLKKSAYDREMSLQLYECLNGIIQKAHAAGDISTAERAKSWLREQNYLIVFPTEGAAEKAA